MAIQLYWKQIMTMAHLKSSQNPFCFKRRCEPAALSSSYCIKALFFSISLHDPFLSFRGDRVQLGIESALGSPEGG